MGTSKGEILIRTQHLDDAIYISFTDNGTGMDPDTLDRIFDPFFITKEVGEGTGLGLSVSMGIIENHKGKISINSRKGEGTRVEITLPTGTPYPKRKKKLFSKDINLLPLGKRILIVDDEKEILSFFVMLFEKYGWKTVPVTDGSEALVHISREKFDIILSDMKMPGLSGREMYHILKDQNSDQIDKIIISTGDTISEDTATFLEESKVLYLKKPVDLNELTCLISSIISDN